MAEWDATLAAETALFVLLIVAAGSFPLPVGPEVKTDIATAAAFAAALVLEPGAAALAATVGMVTYTYLLRYWALKVRLPWYKYPFNAGATALSIGLTSAAFHGLATGEELLTLAVLPAVAVKYLVNSTLVTGAASLELSANPFRFWWAGSKVNGPAEISLMAFGFLGALAYQQSPWTVIALFVPVAIIYLAFSRLNHTNIQLSEAHDKLEALQGQIASRSKLASIGQMSLEMVHQVKNPLTILLGRLELLEDRIDETSDYRRDLDTAMNAGWRIDELVRNFTSIGLRKTVPVDVHRLLSEALATTGIASRLDIETRTLHEDGPLTVSGNPVLLREALSNIISNAVEAVDTDGVITMATSRSNGAVLVQVSDTGGGVPQEVMDHLFEPFRTTKENGSGLGLFAAKHILEMYEGDLTVESEEGRGTSVTVTLPAAPPSSEAGDYAPPEDSGIRQPAQSR